MDRAASSEPPACLRDDFAGKNSGAKTAPPRDFLQATGPVFPVTLNGMPPNWALRFLVTFACWLGMLPPMEALAKRPTPRAPRALHVKGKDILDSRGRRVVLRGVSIPDPEFANLKRPGQTAPKLIERAVRELHANVVRIPVHPGEDGITGFFVDPGAYFTKHLLPAIDKCEELGVYAIVDLHYVSDYPKLQAKVAEFWRFVTPKLKGRRHVLFEIFNEPVRPSDWKTWRDTVAQPTVDLVRGLGAKNLVIVGGPEWCTKLAKAAEYPVSGKNIAYAAHIYPRQAPATWDRDFGPLLDRFPVFVTEWGYEPGAPNGVSGTTSGFGVPMRAWLDRHGLSWTAWVFDNEWHGKMSNADWSLKGEKAGSGEFVKRYLESRR